MSEVKHTPGEWSVVERGNCGFGPEADVVGPSSDCIRGDYTLADARLIASAPLLLKELKRLVRLLEPQERDGSLAVPGLATLNGPHAAIAKATGA